MLRSRRATEKCLVSCTLATLKEKKREFLEYSTVRTQGSDSTFPEGSHEELHLTQRKVRLIVHRKTTSFSTWVA